MKFSSSTLYWIAVISLAILLSLYVLLSAGGEIHFADGHGPDPGSTEYRAIQRGQVEAAPGWAAIGFALVIMLGAVGWALRWVAGRVVQALGRPGREWIEP